MSQAHFPPDLSEIAAKLAVHDNEIETLSKQAALNSERYHNIQNSLHSLGLKIELLGAKPACPDPGACVRVIAMHNQMEREHDQFVKEIEIRLTALESLRSRFYGALWAFGLSGTAIGVLSTFIAKHLGIFP